MKKIIFLSLILILTSCASKKLFLNNVQFSEEQATAVEGVIKQQVDKAVNDTKQNQIHKYSLKKESIKTLEDLILVLESSGFTVEFNHAKKEEVDKLLKVQKFFDRKD